MKRKSKKRQWPNVYKRKHRSGQASYVVDLGLINGTRERHSFNDKTSADTFAEQKRTDRKNEGTAALALSQQTRADAVKAEKLLKPHGVTLEEAAKYFDTHVIAYRNAPTVTEIINKLVTEAGQNNRRDRTIRELKERLKVFSEDFPNTRLSEISLDQLKEWFAEADDWAPRTKINYLTKISQLYNYALKHNWVDSNLVERIDRPNAEDKEPGIFTVEQAASLLKHADDHDLLPYISIGLFAGLRSAELMRLKAEAIKMEEKQIVVGPDVAKKRSRRVVEMSENLHAWLIAAGKLKGLIVDADEFRENMAELRTAAGIETWPHNGLRHSFGSYHLAEYGDGNKTATQMGHRDQNVIHNHYKALVLKSEADKYWALSPEDDEKSGDD